MGPGGPATVVEVRNIPQYLNQDEFSRLFRQLQGFQSCALHLVGSEPVGFVTFADGVCAAAARRSYNGWQGWGPKGLAVEVQQEYYAPSQPAPRQQPYQSRPPKRELEATAEPAGPAQGYKQYRYAAPKQTPPPEYLRPAVAAAPSGLGSLVPQGPGHHPIGTSVMYQTPQPQAIQHHSAPAPYVPQQQQQQQPPPRQQQQQQQPPRQQQLQPPSQQQAPAYQHQPPPPPQRQHQQQPSQQQQHQQPSPNQQHQQQPHQQQQQQRQQPEQPYSHQQPQSNQYPQQPLPQQQPQYQPVQASRAPSVMQSDPRLSSTEVRSSLPPIGAPSQIAQHQGAVLGLGAPISPPTQQPVVRGGGAAQGALGNGVPPGLMPGGPGPYGAPIAAAQTRPAPVQEYRPAPLGTDMGKHMQQQQQQQPAQHQQPGQPAVHNPGPGIPGSIPHAAAPAGAAAYGVAPSYSQPEESGGYGYQPQPTAPQVGPYGGPSGYEPQSPVSPEQYVPEAKDSNTNLPHDAVDSLYVEGLPVDISKREVAHIFRPFEGFQSVRMIPKSKPGEPGVLCFVRFESPANARVALTTLQGYPMDLETESTSLLRLSFARQRADRGRPASRGGHQGGRTGRQAGRGGRPAESFATGRVVGGGRGPVQDPAPIVPPPRMDAPLRMDAPVYQPPNGGAAGASQGWVAEQRPRGGWTQGAGGRGGGYPGQYMPH